MFTSGTVGSPRAAMLSHGNLLANLDQIQAAGGTEQLSTDVVFGLLPLFHIFGLNVVLDLTPARRRRACCSSSASIPSSAIEAIERHGVTDDQRAADHVVGAGRRSPG